MIKLDDFNIIVIIGIISVIILIFYLNILKSNKMTGLIVGKIGTKQIKAFGTSNCGDGYCDNSENHEVCEIDCPYPETH